MSRTWGDEDEGEEEEEEEEHEEEEDLLAVAFPEVGEKDELDRAATPQWLV